MQTLCENLVNVVIPQLQTTIHKYDTYKSPFTVAEEVDIFNKAKYTGSNSLNREDAVKKGEIDRLRELDSSKNMRMNQNTYMTPNYSSYAKSGLEFFLEHDPSSKARIRHRRQIGIQCLQPYSPVMNHKKTEKS